MIDQSRKILVPLLLVGGGALILARWTFWGTVAGFLCWGAATALALPWAPSTPGVHFFSTRFPRFGQPLRWSPKILFVLALVLLVLVECTTVFFASGHWWSLLAAVITIGALFYLLENHSESFEATDPEDKIEAWLNRPYRPEMLILLVGVFFLFVPFGKGLPYYICDSGECDTSFRLSSAFIANPEMTTPYMDLWSSGQCAFPHFCEGLFMHLVGVSKLKDVLGISLANLAGLFFFYWYACFYLPKRSSLLATFMLAACHLGLYYARQSYAGAGFLIPLTSATFYFFTKAALEGKVRDFVIFGFLLACDSMSYLPAHMDAFYFAFFLLFIAFTKWKEFLKQWKLWLWALASFLLWYSPRIIHVWQHPDSFLFFNIHILKQYNVLGDSGGFPWDKLNHFASDLEMFTVRIVNMDGMGLPVLSPWEGVLLFAGIFWCVWRCYEPGFLILFVGFFGGIAMDAATGGRNLPHRIITAVPFAYLLIGFGLEKLQRAVTVPLGRRPGAWTGVLFLVAFTLFSIGWQYDVFFHQFTLSKVVWVNEGEDAFGKVTASHLKGWDTYDAGLAADYRPEGGAYYFESDMGNKLITRLKDVVLPLKNVPVKGTLVILNDEYGKLYGPWLHYYYPDSEEKIAYSSFNEVLFRYWEITPDQIQKALGTSKAPPSDGLILSWHDAAGHNLGHWQVPALSANLLRNQWFGGSAQGPMPGKTVTGYTISGYLDHRSGEVLSFMGTGSVSGTIGGVPIQWKDTGGQNRFILKSIPSRWVLVQLKYAPVQGVFDLNLYQHGPTGWDWASGEALRVSKPVDANP